MSPLVVKKKTRNTISARYMYMYKFQKKKIQSQKL